MPFLLWPTASACWCTAASLPPTHPRRSAPMRTCARPILATVLPTANYIATRLGQLRYAVPRQFGGGPCAYVGCVVEVSMLEVDQVTAGYGQSQALFGVSLRVEAGEVVTLMGRNGMGKTTTVHAIMGLVPAWSGSICFNGREMGG